MDVIISKRSMRNLGERVLGALERYSHIKHREVAEGLLVLAVTQIPTLISVLGGKPHTWEDTLIFGAAGLFVGIPMIVLVNTCLRFGEGWARLEKKEWEARLQEY